MCVCIYVSFCIARDFFHQTNSYMRKKEYNEAIIDYINKTSLMVT